VSFANCPKPWWMKHDTFLNLFYWKHKKSTKTSSSPSPNGVACVRHLDPLIEVNHTQVMMAKKNCCHQLNWLWEAFIEEKWSRVALNVHNICFFLLPSEKSILCDLMVMMVNLWGRYFVRHLQKKNSQRFLILRL
jgi:hypothetical protein